MERERFRLASARYAAAVACHRRCLAASTVRRWKAHILRGRARLAASRHHVRRQNSALPPPTPWPITALADAHPCRLAAESSIRSTA